MPEQPMAARPRVLISAYTFPEVLEAARVHFEVDDNQAREVLSPEALARRLAPKEGVLVTGTDRIGEPVLAHCPGLRAVCCSAVGYNNIDVEACTRRGILVTNTPGLLDETTADLGFALLLAAARRLGEAERFLRAGRWTQWHNDLLLGADVHGATLGIVGMGRIGRAVARRARGFGMKVLYHNRHRAEARVEAELEATHQPLEQLLAQSDFVCLCLPYTLAVHHLIGARQLALMKPSAVLVNIARGGIIDENALVQALRSGRIAAAGLDVFEGEPAINPDLLTLDNAVLVPHIGSATRATRLAMGRCALENLIAALAGQRPPNLVNPQALARRAGPPD
jgi:lactate dehydrogenase-like 2-hydroxyacid dehydrogenase